MSLAIPRSRQEYYAHVKQRWQELRAQTPQLWLGYVREYDLIEADRVDVVNNGLLDWSALRSKVDDWQADSFIVHHDTVSILKAVPLCPIGTMIMYVKENVTYVGVSMVHPRDTWNKNVGRVKAYEAAQPLRVDSKETLFMPIAFLCNYIADIALRGEVILNLTRMVERVARRNVLPGLEVLHVPLETASV